MTTPTASHRQLSLELRTRTTDHHAQAEHRPFQRAMVEGGISREAYRAWLHDMRLIHEALAGAWPAAAAAEPALARLSGYATDKPALLRADEEALGGPATTTITPAASALVALIRDAARTRHGALVGVLYVLEGSTNGNRVIAARLGRALGLEGAGLTYLNPYGADQRQRWAEFKTLLDDLTLSPDQTEAAVEAAQQVFLRIGEMGDELQA